RGGARYTPEGRKCKGTGAVTSKIDGARAWSRRRRQRRVRRSRSRIRHPATGAGCGRDQFLRQPRSRAPPPRRLGGPGRAWQGLRRPHKLLPLRSPPPQAWERREGGIWGSKSDEKRPMKSGWVDQDVRVTIDRYAQQGIGVDLAQRIYTTRLLGREPRLV